MATTTTYQYSVRDRAGKVRFGHARGGLAGCGRRQAEAAGLHAGQHRRAQAGMKSELKIPGFGGKVKLKDLAVMSRQFATMINSGLSLLRALNILSEQTPNPKLAEVLREVRNEVETGNALSAAMGKFPDVFPPLMVNMIKAGEVGGFLDEVLLQIAENYEAEVRLKGQGQVRHDLPGRRVRHGDPRGGRHAPVHRPGLRQDVRRPGGRPAGADPDPGQPVQHPEDVLPGPDRHARGRRCSSGVGSSAPTASATSSTR